MSIQKSFYKCTYFRLTREIIKIAGSIGIISLNSVPLGKTFVPLIHYLLFLDVFDINFILDSMGVELILEMRNLVCCD